MELPVFAYFPNAASDGTFNEVERRTPNFPTWQDWEWPVHCGDVMAYLGAPDVDGLRRHPDAYEALRDELRAFDWGDDEENLYGLSFYLFRCPICGVHRAKWDMD